jgi:hypothetical protein
LAAFHAQQVVADAHCRAWWRWPGDAREGSTAVLAARARDEVPGAVALGRRARAEVTRGVRDGGAGCKRRELSRGAQEVT